jgi:small-conductance mechanosensitive channel
MVKHLILNTILKDERVIINLHPPSVSCIKAGGGTYTLQANFFTTEHDNGLVVASITENINKEFARNKISEPIPHMIIHQA